MVNIGRNQECPCGSGLKYKKCCGKPAPKQFQFNLNQVVTCLVKEFGGEVNISLGLMQSIPPELRIVFKVVGDKLNVKLVKKTDEKSEPTILLPPERKLITP